MNNLMAQRREISSSKEAAIKLLSDLGLLKTTPETTTASKTTRKAKAKR